MSNGIVVVGGGFAGFWAAVAARRVAGPDLPITLVSRTPQLVMRPRLYEAHPEALAVDIRPLLALVDVVFAGATATAVDVDGHLVLADDRRRFAYERLVMAVGSVMRRPDVPGAADAFSIDTQKDAIVFDQHLAEVVRGRRRIRNEVSVAIVGAGFTGIEFALEFADRLAAHGADPADGTRVILVDRSSVIGADLGAGPRPVIEDALRTAGVELCLGADVAALGSDRITFGDGSVLDVDAVVLATGLVAAPLVADVPGERGGQGRILVDEALRAPGAPHVFVTGDAASADTGDGHRSLQSCQHALQLGRFAGENAARDLLGQETMPYEQRRYVTCLDLGRSGAVLTNGWDREVVQTGEAAKAIKRRINTEVIYPAAGMTAAELLALSTLPARSAG